MWKRPYTTELRSWDNSIVQLLLKCNGNHFGILGEFSEHRALIWGNLEILVENRKTPGIFFNFQKNPVRVLWESCEISVANI